MRRFPAALSLAALAAVSPAAHASCGSASCAVNAEWTSESLVAGEGSALDLRYERVVQDRLRSGSRRVAIGEVASDHDEVRTANHNLVVTYTHAFASGWGYAIAAPLVDRDHLHIASDEGAAVPERWKFRELGDVRVTGKFERPFGDQESGAQAAGIVFGLKLPTGRTNVANAGGDIAERSLQPGTGTTDAIFGVFYQRQLAGQQASWFARVQAQAPLASHAQYRPGTQTSADVGYARNIAGRVSALVQLNAVIKGRDRGAQGEPEDSGGRSLFVSPGAGWDATDSLRVYGFYQVPLYQHVNGVQLTASRALSVGMTARF